MSVTPRPPIPSFLPETAPFTPEQRAWLNGLFAGLFGLRRRRHAAVARRTPPSCCPIWSMRRLSRRPRSTTARPGTTRRCRCRTA